MANILITSDYAPTSGGVANYYRNLAAHMPGSLTVISDAQALFSALGPCRWRKAIKTISEKISSDDALIVGQILPFGTAAWLTSLKHDINYYIVLHGLDFSLATRNAWKRWLSGRIITRSSGVICANSAVQRKLLAIYPQTKSVVITPGLGRERPLGHEKRAAELKQEHHLENKVILVSLGRLVRRKGFDMAIESLAHLKSQASPVYDNLAYVICGEGPDRQYLENLAKERGISVIFIGAASELDKWGWLKASDIFIMPSRDIKGDFEGFGIVFLEAQSLGKAVIGGRSGGIADAIIDGKTGLLVDPEDVSDIAKTIEMLACDSSKRERLGEAGKARIDMDFDWKDLARNFEDFVISNKRYGINSHSGI